MKSSGWRNSDRLACGLNGLAHGLNGLARELSFLFFKKIMKIMKILRKRRKFFLMIQKFSSLVMFKSHDNEYIDMFV